MVVLLYYILCGVRRTFLIYYLWFSLATTIGAFIKAALLLMGLYNFIWNFKTPNKKSCKFSKCKHRRGNRYFKKWKLLIVNLQFNFQARPSNCYTTGTHLLHTQNFSPKIIQFPNEKWYFSAPVRFQILKSLETMPYPHPKLLERYGLEGSMHSIKISVYCEQYLRDIPVIRNKYDLDLWSNLVSNLCHKFKGYSLSNGCCIFIYGVISGSCGMCRSASAPTTFERTRRDVCSQLCA